MSQPVGSGDSERARPPEQRAGLRHHVAVGATFAAALTVVLADGHPATRHGLRSVLERTGTIAVVGEAATAAEVIAETARHQPDVLMVDLQLDEPAGAHLITRVTKVAPDTGVLVFSAVDDDDAIRSAIRAGALGYLVKDAGPDQILRGIEAVAAGQAIACTAVARRIGALMHPADRTHSYPFPQLTNRERDVLERIAAGKSNTVIARELSLAPKTVSNRVSTVFGKLGVADRAQAIVLARNAGLGYD